MGNSGKRSSLGLILIRLCLPVTSAEENKPPVITFQDIIDGTRNFHLEMRISEGHFCDVYRAQIGSEKVAVKLFKQVSFDFHTIQGVIFGKCDCKGN